MDAEDLRELLADNFDEDMPDDILDPDYQANMFLIESAMREVRAEKPVAQPRSPYDAALMKLINSVPLR